MLEVSKKKVWSVEEVADKVRVHKKMILKAIRNGLLKANDSLGETLITSQTLW